MGGEGGAGRTRRREPFLLETEIIARKIVNNKKLTAHIILLTSNIDFRVGAPGGAIDAPCQKAADNVYKGFRRRPNSVTPDEIIGRYQGRNIDHRLRDILS